MFLVFSWMLALLSDAGHGISRQGALQAGGHNMANY